MVQSGIVVICTAFCRWPQCPCAGVGKWPMRIGCVFMILLTSLFIQGCSRDDILCKHAFDLSPTEMLEQNDYVAMARLVQVDTVAFFGDYPGISEEMGRYLVEYAFRVEDLIKGSPEDTVLYVWFPASVNRSTGYRSSVFYNNGEYGLLYGGRIESSDEIIQIMTPRIYGSLEAFSDSLTRRTWNSDGPKWNNDHFFVAESLIHNEDIKVRLMSSIAEGPVLFGTDPEYRTAQAFGEGTLHYCESDDPMSIATRRTAEEYLDELREIAGSMPR